MLEMNGFLRCFFCRLPIYPEEDSYHRSFPYTVSLVTTVLYSQVKD